MITTDKWDNNIIRGYGRSSRAIGDADEQDGEDQDKPQEEEETEHEEDEEEEVAR